MGTGNLSLGVKRPGCETDHSPPSRVEVKECVEIYLHSPEVFMEWCLVKHRDNFTFTFYINYITVTRYHHSALEKKNILVKTLVKSY
jgi:hypothetical protein